MFLPRIIKEIPQSNERRLPPFSSLKNIFQEPAINYEKCLKNNIKLSYNINNQKKAIKIKGKKV